ncbi:MAG: hypothetical protein V1846_00200 [Candidatus Komeilibacteria bacterium]
MRNRLFGAVLISGGAVPIMGAAILATTKSPHWPAMAINGILALMLLLTGVVLGIWGGLVFRRYFV